MTGATFAGGALDPGTFHVDAPDRVRVRVPLRATGTGAFSLAFPGGTLDTAGLTVVFPAPTLDAVAPDAAFVGEEVVLRGAHLGTATLVTFEGTAAAAIRPMGPGQIAVDVPPGARSGQIRVATPGGAATLLDPGTGAPFVFQVRPRILSLLPLSGPPGTEVTVRGSGLRGATFVRVAEGWSWIGTSSPDGTVATFTVPAGAAPGTSGPVRIYKRGLEAASAESFTLTHYRAPRIAARAPAQGPPGTQVVLEGDNLKEVTEVLYAGAPLRPGSWQVVTEPPLPPAIHAVVPPGAGPGVFTVVNPAGRSDSAPFTVIHLHSRAELLMEVLHHTVHLSESLDWPSADRSRIYGAFWPKTPMFHAYHPMVPDDAEGALRPGHHAMPVALLALSLPETFREVLPAALQAQLAALPLPPAPPLEIHVVSQNQPYAATLRFRPHYWLYDGTPFMATDASNRERTAGMGLYDDPGAPSPVVFAGHPPGHFLTGPETDTSVHTQGGAAPYPTVMICSPANLATAGLDPAHSRAFWSLVQDDHDPFRPGRTLATLHLLLRDEDQEALAALTPHVVTFEDLLQAMRADPVLGASPATEALLDLVRPRITGASLAPGGGGAMTVTLHGSGLLGITALEVGGTAATGIHRVSDTLATATVAGLAGPGPHVYRVATLPFLTATGTY